MIEVELKQKRGFREKHFLKEDGEIVARIYSENIHYLKNGHFEEIDNTLIKKNKNYSNKANDYKVLFEKESKNLLMRMQKDKAYLEFILNSAREVKINSKNSKSKLSSNIRFNNVMDNIDIDYVVLPTKVREKIIFKDNDSLKNKLIFTIKTDLLLSLKDDIIIAKEKDKDIFKINLFMEDDYLFNEFVCYSLDKKEDGYDLSISFNKRKLINKNRSFPIFLTFDITCDNENMSSCYISSDNRVHHNNEVLKSGVERVNNQDIINRTLLKFNMPNIGTGFKLLKAILKLNSYYTSLLNSNDLKKVTFNKITEQWDNKTINWDNMKDKYSSKIESIGFFARSPKIGNDEKVYSNFADGDITELVNSWYTNTPNYGLVIKSLEEIYSDDNYPEFFFKDYLSFDTYQPKLEITYKESSGLEPYFNYLNQKFTIGNTYVNTENGNLIGLFNVGSINNKNFILNVALLYSTNNKVTDKNSIYGNGVRLNIDEILEANESIITYYDSNNSCHYFIKEGDRVNSLGDLNIKIEMEKDHYKILDKVGNKKTFSSFNNSFYLDKIEYIDNNIVTIKRDEENRITQISSKSGNCINFAYDKNKIVITSLDNVVLNYSNNNLYSIVLKDETINFVYDNNNLICKIESQKLNVEFEYYENKPYKIKKVTEYDIPNELRKTFYLTYGLNTSVITNDKGKMNVLSYNENGNVIVNNILPNKDDLESAYCTVYEYGNSSFDKNKIINQTFPLRYTNNFLNNMSFEPSDISLVEFENEVIDATNEFPTSYLSSLKVKTTGLKQYIYKTVDLPKGRDYTFSGYFKSNKDFYINLYFEKIDKTTVAKSIKVYKSDDFIQYDINILYEKSAKSKLFIKFIFDELTTVFIGNIMLEDKKTVGNYNELESSFEDNLKKWNISSYKAFTEEKIASDGIYEIVNINSSGKKALKVNMKPSVRSNINRIFNIRGRKNDKLRISFWYKNSGIPSTAFYSSNSFTLFCKPVNDRYDECCYLSVDLNNCSDIWQYISYDYVAPFDYQSIMLEFDEAAEANFLYITNLALYKNLLTKEYPYDRYGNLIGYTDSNGQITSFNYDGNNRITKIDNIDGVSLSFEYDKFYNNRVFSFTFPSRAINKIKYDETGNIVSIKTSRINTSIEDGLYKIRCKETNNYLKLVDNLLSAKGDCLDNTTWKIEKDGNCYKIKLALLSDYLLNYNNNILNVSKSKINNLFYLEPTCSNSFNIYTVNESSSNRKYLKVESESLFLVDSKDLDKIDNTSLEFYFENKEEIFMEHTFCYPNNNTIAKKEFNNNFIKEKYEIVSLIEFLRKNKILKDKSNLCNLNSNLPCTNNDNLEYNFDYDEFLNIKGIFLDNNLSLKKSYEKDGKTLLSITYKNNGTISFECDKLGRIETCQRNDDDYHFRYDSNNNLFSLSSSNEIIKYKYDNLRRIVGIYNDDFKINYNYGKNSLRKTFSKGDLSNSALDIFNNDNLLTQSIHDDIIFNYEYDDFGRLANIKLNDNYEMKYEYLTFGKRTTNLIKSISCKDTVFKYKYGTSNNIEEIYRNEELIYKDIHSSKENDKMNLLKDLEITYDECNNPLTFGHSITLNWINGKTLSRYEDKEKNLTIEYKYNNYGVRTRKIVNGNVTNYYLEGNNIIYEERPNYSIYYLYNDTGLVGFKYNGEIYYYVKSPLEDIMEILNSNYEVVATYEYDSFGKVLKVKDEKGRIVVGLDHIGMINPFRYRSYYYDDENALYYSSGKYYNKDWGIFINDNNNISKEYIKI